jgi:hypothetical protein
MASFLFTSLSVSMFVADLTAHVVNPLHAALPPFVMALSPNCNTFIADDVRKEMATVDTIVTKHLGPILGSFVGSATGTLACSDGASNS